MCVWCVGVIMRYSNCHNKKLIGGQLKIVLEIKVPPVVEQHLVE